MWFAANMDINDESVRSFSQLLKRANSDPGLNSTEQISKLGLPKMDDEEVPLPTVIRQDSIASRVSLYLGLYCFSWLLLGMTYT